MGAGRKIHPALAGTKKISDNQHVVGGTCGKRGGNALFYVSLLNTDFCVLIGHRLLCPPVISHSQREPKFVGRKEILLCHIHSSELANILE
jgi:hypothetical protein